MENNQPRPKLMPWILLCLIVAMGASLFFNSRFFSEYPSQTEVPTTPTETQSEDTDTPPFRMERIGSDTSFDFYRDTVTDVLYLRLDFADESGLTVMLDPETGLPLTYARYMEIYNQAADNAA